MRTLFTCPESRKLFIGVMHEVYAVARRSGVHLAEDVVERTLRHMEKELPPGILDSTRGSMYFGVTKGPRRRQHRVKASFHSNSIGKGCL